VWKYYRGYEKVIVNGMHDSSLTKEKIPQLIKNHDASLTFVIILGVSIFDDKLLF